MKKIDRKIFLSFLSNFFRIKKARGRLKRKIFTKLWTRIWIQEGYAEEKEKEKIREKYKAIEKWSVDYLLFFLAIFPVGTIRFVTGPEKELPVIRDFAVTKIWNGKIIEVTLLTVSKTFRGLQNLSSLMLMREMYTFCMREGYCGIVIAADKRLFSLLKRKLSLPLKQIGEEKFYEGSITIPAYLDFEEAKKNLEVDPDLLEFFLKQLSF